MIGEMGAGHIVNKKMREPTGERTIDYYCKAVAYLNGVVGEQALAETVPKEVEPRKGFTPRPSVQLPSN